MQPVRRSLRRWLPLASLFILLAFLGIAGARTPIGGAGPPAAGVLDAFAPPTDPNFTDPDWGAPKSALPVVGVKGWAPNQDVRKPKLFPHYGRIELNLCDLPVHDMRGTFNKWTEAQMRSWCRGELTKVHGMDADYTNHELVEEVPDGMGGKKKVLAVYKTWKLDHEKAGRGKLYHPRTGNTDNYYGGIAQIQALPQSAFEKAKPKKKRVTLDDEGQPIGVEANTACPGGVCEICGPCAETPEEAAPWCGDATSCEVVP